MPGALGKSSLPFLKAQIEALTFSWAGVLSRSSTRRGLEGKGTGMGPLLENVLNS